MTTARDQLKSIIDRILRLKEEQDTLGEDVREVYAEAKSNGYDKTALGSAVTIIRKRLKHGTAAMLERETLADLYLAEYEGMVAGARARVEIIEESSGESRERQTPKAPAMAIVGSKPEAPSQSEALPRQGSARTAASPQMDEDIPTLLRRAG